jgi:hypothetical protein
MEPFVDSRVRCLFDKKHQSDENPPCAGRELDIGHRAASRNVTGLPAPQVAVAIWKAIITGSQ